MNTPNKLTVFRIILVPFIIAATLISFPFHDIVAGLLFGAAALTDMFDGKIARRDNLVTDFGKFADPLADKILVISSFVCFLRGPINISNSSLALSPVISGLPIAVPIIIVLLREFSVTSIRLVAASKGRVIAANMWGKVKTVSQIVAALIYYLLFGLFDGFVLYVGNHPEIADASSLLLGTYSVIYIVATVAIWISTIFTIISGVKYIVDNKDVIKEK